jgi:hypothetical protein
MVQPRSFSLRQQGTSSFMRCFFSFARRAKEKKQQKIMKNRFPTPNP